MNVGVSMHNNHQSNEIIKEKRSKMTDLACRLAKIGSWLLDVKTMTIEWSQEMFDIFELPLGETPSLHQMMNLFYGESCEKFFQALDAIIKRAESCVLDLQYETIHGKNKWFRSILSPVLEDGIVISIEGTIQDITNEHAILNKAERQESIIDSFFEAIPDLYFILDFDGKILEYRAHKNTNFYASPENFLDKYLADIMPLVVVELFSSSLAYAKEKQGTTRFEYELDSPDGKTKMYFECRMSLLENRQQCIAVIRDITEQYLAVQALSESEARYRGLLERAPFPIFISRLHNGEIRYSNERAKEAFGFMGNEAVGLMASQFYQNPTDPSRFKERLLKEGSVTDEEFAMVNLQGKKFWLLVSSTIIEFENEPALLTSINDITTRKQMEEELKVSEEKYRSLTEYTSDVIWVLNVTQQKFTYISPSVEQLRGYTPEEVLSNSVEQSVAPESYALALKCIQSTMEEFIQNPEEAKTYITELQQPCKNGDLVWVEMATKFRYNALGEIELFGVSRNIEARKKMEQEVLYLSYHDQLTGVYNRRYYEENLQQIDSENNLPLTIVMADVNGLKLTNDAFGHLVGDKLLTTFADVLKQQRREHDFISRIGGDEFVLLLPNTDEATAEQFVNKIRLAVANQHVEKIQVSASIGFKTKTNMNQSFDEIYKIAEDSMYRRKLLEGKDFRKNTLDVINQTLHQKYPMEKCHSEKVSEYCKKIGEALKMSAEDIHDLGVAGLLHDIGKIGIDDRILYKQGEFTLEEWKIIERHPEIGYQILRSISEFADIAEIILAHHEQLDGKGYPKGLTENLIPQKAKVLSVAEAFVSMTEPNIYKYSLCIDEAVQELKKNAGTQFDEQIVKVFVEQVLEKSWNH